MAFFNLTHLGVQDPIKSSLKEKCTYENTKNESTNENKEGEEISCQPAHLSKNEPTSKSLSEAQGSYVKYTERLTKHQRIKNDPNEIYRKPVVSSQDYGWWKQDGAPESLPWTKTQRCARVNSEMTRFVDEMTLTNKHFTLF